MNDFFGHDAQYLAHLMLNRLTSQEFDKIFKEGQSQDDTFSHVFANSCAVNAIDAVAQCEDLESQLPSVIRRFVNAVSVLNNDDFYFAVSYLESQLVMMSQLTYTKDNCTFFKPEISDIVMSNFVTRKNMMTDLFLSDFKA